MRIERSHPPLRACSTHVLLAAMLALQPSCRCSSGSVGASAASGAPGQVAPTGTSPTTESAPALGGKLSAPVKRAALRDLQQDLITARGAIASGRNPVYAIDRLALAARELSPERDGARFSQSGASHASQGSASLEMEPDEKVRDLLAEAETIYGLQGPLAWADVKLKEAATEKNAPAILTACDTARDMLNRVLPKYASQNEVVEMKARFKAQCRSTRLQAAAPGDAESSVSTSAIVRYARCRRRCDLASWSCESNCQTISFCSPSEAETQCETRRKICLQGCSQNKKFCEAACS